MKVDIYCFGCQTKLRAPSVGKGTVSCPYCKSKLTLEDGKIIKSRLSSKTSTSTTKTDYRPLLVMAIVFVVVTAFMSIKDKFQAWNKSTENDSSNPRIEFKNNDVHLYNLTYTVGFTGINEVNTNLENFDQLVWDELRRIGGTHRIVRHYSERDRYGNVKEQEQDFGSVNLSELDKYQSFDDFKKDGGFYQIIEKK